jgi:membrane protease YdiL (CAAX protease family)
MKADSMDTNESTNRSSANKGLTTWGLLLLMLLSWFTVSIILTLPFFFLKKDFLANDNTITSLDEFISLIATIITVFVWHEYIHKEKSAVIELGGFRTKWKDLLWGLFYGAAVISIGFFTCYATGLIQIVSIQFAPEKVFVVLVCLVLVAFTEEILCRGYILRRLMTAYPPYIALLLSSFVFMLLHVFNQNVCLIGLLNIFISGFWFGLYYIRYQNLWFPIGLHFAWNFCQSPLFGFEVSGHKLYNIITQQQVEEMDWLTGGSFGFEGSILCTFIAILLIIVTHFQFNSQIQKNQSC